MSVHDGILPAPLPLQPFLFYEFKKSKRLELKKRRLHLQLNGFGQEVGPANDEILARAAAKWEASENTLFPPRERIAANEPRVVPGLDSDDEDEGEVIRPLLPPAYKPYPSPAVRFGPALLQPKTEVVLTSGTTSTHIESRLLRCVLSGLLIVVVSGFLFDVFDRWRWLRSRYYQYEAERLIQCSSAGTRFPCEGLQYLIDQGPPGFTLSLVHVVGRATAAHWSFFVIVLGSLLAWTYLRQLGRKYA